MSDLSWGLGSTLEWLGRASWQATVLAGLVMLVQRALGKRLTPAWRYRLWLLVVVRLVLPFQPPSITSVHNLARLPLPGTDTGTTASTPWVVSKAEPTVENTIASGIRKPFSELVISEARTEEIRSAVNADRQPPVRTDERSGFELGRKSVGWSWRVVAAWIWLAGAAALLLRIMIQNLAFQARLRREATPAGPELAGLLEKCRHVLGVGVPIVVLETSQVQSPAVYGFLRPTLLMPRGLAAEFSEGELRYVLLHEVAHVKRWDTAMTWVMALLQALHWFNPVLWLVFARMRADRELACDALVLNRGHDGEALGYGETILRLVEVMSRAKAMPGLVGILEDKAQIAERIRMIAGFRRPGRASACAGLLVLMLGWVGLTDAAPGAKPLPPVVPLRLTNLLAAPENRAWKEEAVWKAPPRGSNVFGGIEFHLDGLIQLAGTGPEGDGKRFRDRVIVPLQETNGVGPKARIIQRGTNVGALHLVGGTAYDAPGETKIAEVIWRYTDGTFKRTPILYGVHLRDWWRARYEQPARLPGPHAKVIWRGTHTDATRSAGKTLRLYRLSLANPEPKRVIRQLEFVSARARPATLILAMTLDPLAPGERPDNTADLEEADPELTGHLQVTVQDLEGKPLPEAEIRLLAREKGQSSGGTEVPGTFKTDAQGFVDVLRPGDGIERLEISVSKADYGVRKVVWDTKTGDVLPTSTTVQLRGAIRIGGTVVDPDGQPVDGAKVTLFRFWMGGENPGAKGDGIEFLRQEHTTGTDGRWSAGQVPPEILHRIGISAEHPDYIGTRSAGTRNRGRDVVEQLKEGTFELRLGRGLEARGKVLDLDDRPVAGGTVWVGGRNTVERKETQTDGNGAFRFRNLKEGRLLFSVLAKGHEPATQTVLISTQTPEVVFKLGKGSVIRARVENAAGEPLAGARVALEGAGDIGRTYEFSTRTDDDGKFEWDSAPAEPMQFYFYAVGYEQKRDHVLKPNEDNLVVLKRCRQVHGKVVDSDSGEPITRFKVAFGRAWESLPENFHASYPGPADYNAADGSFQLELNDEDHNAIQAEAEEYASLTSILPADQNGDVEILLRLKRTSALRGVLVDATGNPVPGAQVAVTAQPEGPERYIPSSIVLQTDRLERQGRGVLVETVEGGRFIVPSPPEAGIVVAVGPGGFVSAPLSQVRASSRLALLPFGRIEGTFAVLGQPAPNEEFYLNLSSIGIRADFEAYRATTDAEGRFVMDKVPAGNFGLIRLIRTSPGSWEHGPETSVTVQPGQTTRINLGNSGLVVRGRARLETPTTEPDVSIAGHLVTQGPPVPTSFASTEEAKAFFESPVWKAHMDTQKRHAVRVRPDGSLQFDSVGPGTYDLTLTASVPGEQPWKSRPIAEGKTEVVIPAESNPQTAVQIGEVVLKPIPKP